MKIFNVLFLFFISIIFSCNEPILLDDGDDYMTVNPAATSNYTFASFGLHLPETDNIRGILVIVPGYNSNGIDYKDGDVLQDLAEVQGVAILSCFYQGDETHVYYNVDGGSGKALLRAIEEFAYRADMPLLEGLPLLFWGHSAGGMFSLSFMNWRPDLVAGVAAIRTPIYYSEVKDSARAIPAMFLLGEYDEEEVNQSSIDYCTENRTLGALWSYAIEPEFGHGIGNADFLSIPFLVRALNLQPDMVRINEGSGWLGDYSTRVVNSYSTYSGEKSMAAWLPDEYIGDLWKKYQAGDYTY